MSFVRVVRHRKEWVFGNVEAIVVSFLGSQLHSFLKGGDFFFFSGLCFIFAPMGNFTRVWRLRHHIWNWAGHHLKRLGSCLVRIGTLFSVLFGSPLQAAIETLKILAVWCRDSVCGVEVRTVIPERGRCIEVAVHAAMG